MIEISKPDLLAFNYIWISIRLYPYIGIDVDIMNRLAFDYGRFARGSGVHASAQDHMRHKGPGRESLQMPTCSYRTRQGPCRYTCRVFDIQCMSLEG